MKDDPIDDFRIFLKSALKLIQSNRSGAKDMVLKVEILLRKSYFNGRYD